jgi:hypothetical protein
MDPMEPRSVLQRSADPQDAERRSGTLVRHLEIAGGNRKQRRGAEQSGSSGKRKEGRERDLNINGSDVRFYAGGAERLGVSILKSQGKSAAFWLQLEIAGGKLFAIPEISGTLNKKREIGILQPSRDLGDAEEEDRSLVLGER